MLMSDKIERLRQRRFDPIKGQYDVRENFSNTEFSQSTRYIYETMQPISKEYRDITIGAADKVTRHLNRQFNSLDYLHSFRYQGSVTTNTEIAVHSDIDILFMQKDFHYIDLPASKYAGNATNVMKNVQAEIFNKLNSHYNDVTKNPKNIKVNMQNPKRQVDVVPATYHFGPDSSQNIENAGVVIYNNGSYHNKSFPFSVTANINYKARITNEASRRLIRYLKNIKEDSDLDISLTSFEIYTFVHDFLDNHIFGLDGVPLSYYLRKEISEYLVEHKDCESIASPCSTEKPFEHRTTHFNHNMSLIVEELDSIHRDVISDQRNFPRITTEGLKYMTI